MPKGRQERKGVEIGRHAVAETDTSREFSKYGADVERLNSVRNGSVYKTFLLLKTEVYEEFHEERKAPGKLGAEWGNDKLK